MTSAPIMCAPSNSPVSASKTVLIRPSAFAQRNRLAVADEGNPAHLDLAATFFGLGFGQADARHLRPAIGAARHVGGVERMHAFHAGDLLGDDDAFMHRLVRQPGAADQVANGPDAVDAGLAILAGDDVGLFAL